MRTTEERELKLSPGPDFELPPGADPRERNFTSTYLDTEDRRLAALGITLRRRLENGKNLWQLKLPVAAGRRELEVPGGPARVPREFGDVLIAITRGRSLSPAATLRTRRTSVEVREKGSVAEVALDVVAVLDGRRVRESFAEVEVELLSGDASTLGRIGKQLHRAGAEKGDGRPKLVRVLGLGQRNGTAARNAPPLAQLQAMLSRQLEKMLQHDPGTRLGSDSEDLHDLRVATRRLRALLRAARPLLDRDWAEGLRAELSWLGSALGPVRDLDVLIEHLTGELEEFSDEERLAAERLVQALDSERAEARAAMLEALESERYLRLLDALEEAARSPRASTGDRALADIAANEFKRLSKAVRRLSSDPGDEELHRVRIKTKRARYAAELAEAAVGKKAERFVESAKRLQDILGEHQDAIVAEGRIRALLGSIRGTRVAFVGGRLVERERRRRRSSQAEWRDAWKELERSGARAWS
jgi:CHAD domain-containing protein